MENEHAEVQATNEPVEQQDVETVANDVESTDVEETSQVRDEDFVTARLKKAEAEARRAKERLAELKRRKTTSNGVSEDLMMGMLELKDKGFSTPEISKIRTFANTNGLTLDEASKDPFVLGGIKEMRERAKVQEATPAPSQKVKTAPEKTFTELSSGERAEKYSFNAWKQSKKK